MLPACVGRIPALLNTTSFFPTHAGIFYHVFHFLHFAGIFARIFPTDFSEFLTNAGIKHVSGTFEKCGSFFYLGVAQLDQFLFK